LPEEESSAGQFLLWRKTFLRFFKALRPASGLSKPFFEVFGQHLDIFLLKKMKANRVGDIQFQEGLFHPFPKFLPLAFGLGKKKLTDQFLESAQKDGVQMLIIVGDDFLLVSRIVPLSH
jgi:hypothetical protein